MLVPLRSQCASQTLDGDDDDDGDDDHDGDDNGDHDGDDNVHCQRILFFLLHLSRYSAD